MSVKKSIINRVVVLLLTCLLQVFMGCGNGITGASSDMGGARFAPVPVPASSGVDLSLEREKLAQLQAELERQKSDREKMAQQQLELERQKAEIEKARLQQQVEAERRKAEIERENRERLQREADSRLAEEKAKVFSDVEFSALKEAISQSSDNLGQALLGATHPTGTYGDTSPALVVLSPAKDIVTSEITVNWKGFTDNSYTTVYKFRITKRGLSSLDVVKDTAFFKIDPPFLKTAEGVLRDIFDPR